MSLELSPGSDCVTLGKLFNLFELTLLLGKMSISGWLRDLREQTYGYHRRGMVERDSYGVLDGHVHTAIFKMDNQQGPTV